MTCSLVCCKAPATHVSRRFGPESPYCLEDAWWADGVAPMERTAMNRPELLNLG